MDLPIRSITDLRAEIYRLKALEQEKSIALSSRFKNFSSLISTFMSLFPRSVNADGTKSPGFFDQDIVGIISRFVLPLTLNKTIFRNSNFIIKTLVGLISQKASHFITEDSVSGIWDKLLSLFKSKTKTDAPAKEAPVKKDVIPPPAEAIKPDVIILKP